MKVRWLQERHEKQAYSEYVPEYMKQYWYPSRRLQVMVGKKWINVPCEIVTVRRLAKRPRRKGER